MSKKMDATSRIQINIVKEILRECFPRNLKPNEHFVGYFVKLLLMDPNWGITENLMNSRANVQNFVKFVIAQLETQFTIQIITLKMQFYFNCTLEHIATVVDKHKKDILRRLLPLKEDICRTDDTGSAHLLRKKIAIYITLVSGLGNPMLDVVYDEAACALQSILSEDELKEFAQSPRHVKDAKLELMNKVVCGIRLFNKDSDKGGAGVPNLPDLLDRALTVVKNEVQSVLLAIMEKVNMLTSVVDKCYVLKETEDQNYTMVCELPSNVYAPRLEQCKDVLILFRQYELFVRKIIEEIEKLEVHASDIYRNLDELLKKIHRTVHMRIAVPVSIIFPRFEDLSDIWVNLQDQVIMLSKLNDIMMNLESYTKGVNYHKEWLESMMDNQSAVSDAERMEETVEFSLKSHNEEVQVFHIENFKNIDKVRLQFLGFCCWKLVETDGGLIPGNPSMGIVKYKNMNFVFSTPQACESFSKNPDRYIRHALNLGRRKPQLINFLQLKSQLEIVMNVNQLVTEKKAAKVSENKATQLEDDYIFPPNIDRHYKWNTWDYKREALLMANFSKCKTTSTQTTKSHSRNSIPTETYLKQSVSVQTNQDCYTNVPNPSTYIFGLRGRKDDKQFVVDLTQDVTKTK